MTEGRKLLIEWLDRTGMPAAEAARRAGVSQDAFYGWTAGRRTPDLRCAVALRELTGVPVEAWLSGAEEAGGAS